MILPPFMLVR